MKLMLTGAMLMLATAALAGPPPAAPTEIKCAVMPTNKVNIKDATAKKMYADYKGNRYFFCCGGCPTDFKKDPSKFAKAPHIPTPKAAKPAKQS